MTINDAKELATKYRLAVRQAYEFGKQLKDMEYAILFTNNNGESGSEYSDDFPNIDIWKIEKKEI